MASTRNFKDDITVWPASGGSFSGMNFGAPSVIKGRWEDRSEMFRNSVGEEVVSHAIFYPVEDVTLGDYAIKGDYSDTADPTTLTDAYRILQFQKVSDLRNVRMIRKAFV